jgi:hypothetical protein
LDVRSVYKPSRDYWGTSLRREYRGTLRCHDHRVLTMGWLAAALKRMRNFRPGVQVRTFQTVDLFLSLNLFQEMGSWSPANDICFSLDSELNHQWCSACQMRNLGHFRGTDLSATGEGKHSREKGAWDDLMNGRTWLFAVAFSIELELI